ncbi:MAG: hypothetical protein NTX72_04590 [Candidatus Uhrbacteria bacterium]|nr:hypothetical protein [Candidatus Uhrbacteria bacterium]
MRARFLSLAQFYFFVIVSVVAVFACVLGVNIDSAHAQSVSSGSVSVAGGMSPPPYQDAAGLTNPDYDVSLGMDTTGTSGTSITVKFPNAYTVTNGSLGASVVSGCIASCTSSVILIGGMNRDVTSVVGNNTTKTITVTTTSSWDFGAGVSFRITSGFQNPSAVSVTYGNAGTGNEFTLLTDTSGDAEFPTASTITTSAALAITSGTVVYASTNGATNQNAASYVNADYDVALSLLHAGNSGNTITVKFPTAYTITNGDLGVDAVMICTAGCGFSGNISAGSDGSVSVSSVTGNNTTKTITIVTAAPHDFGSGSGTSFRIVLGITNPSSLLTYGNGTNGTFTLLTNSGGDTEFPTLSTTAITDPIKIATGSVTHATTNGASNQNSLSLVDADYDIAFDMSDSGNSGNTIVVKFPSAYTITNGSLSTNDIQICIAGCGQSGNIYVGTEGPVVITSLTGDNTAKTLTIVTSTYHDFGSGSGTSFRIIGGIQNPGVIATYGNGTNGTYTLLTNSGGDVEFSTASQTSVTDLTSPTITSVTTGNASGVGLDKLTVTFSENVKVTDGMDVSDISNTTAWGIYGDDAGGRSVTANTDPAGASNKVVLTLSSPFLIQDPVAFISYSSAFGHVKDVYNNGAENYNYPPGIAIDNGIDATPPTIDAGSFAVPINTATAPIGVSASDTGGIASYAWTQVSAPEGGTLVFSNDAILGTTLAGSVVDGVYTAQLTVTDVAGNFSTDTVAFTWDTTNPTINTLTSNATASGVLKIGDTIVFTATPLVTEAGASITGSTYNGEALTWGTIDGGVTYTATYTVIEGDTDQTSPLQLTGVVLTDEAGNTSDPKNGTDIVKTIDANKPTISAVTILNVAMKVGSVVTATITTGSDASTYVLTSGTINGFTLGSLVKTNATHYTAQFTVTEGGTDRTAGASIPVANLVLTDVAGNASATFSSSITQDNDSIDAHVPVLTGVSISSDNSTTTLAKSGNTITLSITASETLNSLPIVTIDGQTASVSGSGPYSATYLMTGTDVEGAVPFTINFSDVAGNSGVQVTAVTDVSAVLFDRTVPTVNAGADSGDKTAVFTHSDATASDAGSGIATYAWSKLSGLGTVTFGSSTSLITTVLANAYDSYVLRLTVTDAAGNSATDDFAYSFVAVAGPAVVSTSPVGGVTNVAITDGTATITFDKNITLLDVTKVTLKDNDSFVSKKGAVTVSGGDGTSAILLIPYSGLEYNKTYIMRVVANALRDADGNVNGASFYYFTTAALLGGSNGGGGGGGGGAIILPSTPAVPTGTPVVPAAPAVPVAELPTTAAPVVVLIHDPSKFDELLLALGVAIKPAEFAQYKAFVKSDALQFKIGLTEAQQAAIANFVTYGASTATVKLGSGERRALMRDYFETVGKAAVVWDDIQRLATGQKPVQRNLVKEQAQAGIALNAFKKMTGHAPNFKDASEDIAWNTMLYRIRFTRDLVLEQQGILEYKKIFKGTPSSPSQWAIVRALGYALK